MNLSKNTKINLLEFFYRFHAGFKRSFFSSYELLKLKVNLYPINKIILLY